MSDMTHEPKALWQQQTLPPANIDLGLVRSRVRRFHWQVRLRNSVEYVAAVLVIFGYGRHAISIEAPLIKIGSVLIILATLFIVYYLHRHGTAQSLPGDLGARSSIDFVRRQLERQRDLLSTVWLWYLLPFLPGFGFLFVASALQTTPPTWMRAVHGAVFIGGLFAVLALLNLWGARRLQRKIDELPKIDDD